ncbi:helix-turn-helix domain-containing protein [Williamsia sp.]|uniref:helix-turn-helix domain-containing protein n=1 Tax=Williamsia sp. TaxID=1872085 RepID=UPI002F948DEF
MRQMGVVVSKYLSVDQAAEELGVSSKSIRRWISGGRLTARRAGPRLIRIDRREIEKMMSPVGAQ